MKVNLVNDKAETEWSDERTHLLYLRCLIKEIVDTLNKV